MRILYVTANPFLRSTTSSLNAILKELRPRGLEPVMLFREPGPWQESLAADGLPCYFSPLPIPDRGRPWELLKHMRFIHRVLKNERIELIHCNEHEHYPSMRLSARLLGIPMLATLHWNLEPGFGQWAFKRPYTPAALQFLSQAQLDASRHALPEGLDNERVKLLMSGLALDEFLARGDDGQALRATWGAGPETVVLGTASAIKARKRLEDFILLIARLRRSRPNVLGIIAGGGIYTDEDYFTELKALIATEGLGDHCRFIGNLDPVTPFCKAIDISVNTAEMEILSMSICESMACRKPTIAYAVGGNPEAVGDPWAVVPFKDLDALYERAAKLVDDPAFRRETGERAERHVRTHFDAPVLAQRQAGFYEEILGRPLNGQPR